MKPIPFSTITAGIAALLAANARAIEAPADDSPPPPAVSALPAAQAPETARPAPRPQAQAETAYLGVVSSAVPEMLADQLNLKPGEGIVVRALMPEGPAAKGGLAKHDVITRISGKAVGTSEDLTRLVTGHKPGDTLHMELIHKGKPTDLDIKLGSRPAELAALETQPLDQLNLDGVPKDFADRVRKMIQGNLGALDLHLDDGGIDTPPQIEDALREMKQRVQDAAGGANAAPPAEQKLDVQQGATIRLMDDQGSIELKSHDGGKEVTIRDKDNKITWTGPWDTEQDKAAAPNDIRQRVEHLHLDNNIQGNGLRFHLHPGE